MHNFPFLPTHSCVSEAWRSALVNQGFLQQQDPIRPRWRPRGQLGGQAWGIQALCWTPEETKGPVQEKVQRTQAGSLRDANMLKDLGEVPLHPMLTLSFPFTLPYTQTHIFVLFSFFPSDVPIHTSFNNLSPKHTKTYPQPSAGVSSQERGFAREGWRRDVDEKWHRPTECDQASTSAGKTKPASQFYNDDVSLPTWQCVAEVPSFSSFALCFFVLFPSLPFFHCLFFSLCFFFFTKPPFFFLSFFVFVIFPFL